MINPRDSLIWPKLIIWFYFCHFKYILVLRWNKYTFSILIVEKNIYKKKVKENYEKKFIDEWRQNNSKETGFLFCLVYFFKVQSILFNFFDSCHWDEYENSIIFTIRVKILTNNGNESLAQQQN